MHPFLQRQQGDYGVYVAEQTEEAVFNKARLMNLGYKVAEKDYDYNCFIFSDVDVIPMDERNLYRCSEKPKHMGNALDKFNFRLLHPGYIGGVVAFTKEQFLKVNGFSNSFWGWGGEDDEMYQRVLAVGMGIERPDEKIAKAKMIYHKRDAGNKETGKRFYFSTFALFI
ncbi:beta-1,4-galactosyltransferase 1-like [Rhinophrynus dorsalis]